MFIKIIIGWLLFNLAFVLLAVKLGNKRERERKFKNLEISIEEVRG